MQRTRTVSFSVSGPVASVTRGDGLESQDSLLGTLITVRAQHYPKTSLRELRRGRLHMHSSVHRCDIDARAAASAITGAAPEGLRQRQICNLATLATSAHPLLPLPAKTSCRQAVSHRVRASSVSSGPREKTPNTKWRAVHTRRQMPPLCTSRTRARAGPQLKSSPSQHRQHAISGDKHASSEGLRCRLSCFPIIGRL